MRVLITQGTGRKTRQVIRILPTFTDEGTMILTLSLERKRAQSSEAVLIYLAPRDLEMAGMGLVVEWLIAATLRPAGTQPVRHG